jgi:hypothetical protein
MSGLLARWFQGGPMAVEGVEREAGEVMVVVVMEQGNGVT